MATISNGESGSSVRTKLNEIINKVEGVTSIDNNIDVTGTVTADGLTVDGGTGVDLLLHTSAGVSRSVIEGEVVGGAGGKQLFFTNDGGGLKKRMQIDHLGDISFYENTGTTAKFFWDAAAEKVEIAGSGGLKFTGGGVGQDLVWGSSNTDYAAIRVDSPIAQDVELTFHTTTNAGVDGAPEAMRIDSSGNLLLAGNTLLGRNTTDGSDNGYLAVVAGPNESDGRGAITRLYGNEHATNAGRLALSSGNVAGAYMDFRVAGSEAMRIDSSGNLLVGKTTTGATTAGMAWISNEYLQLANSETGAGDRALLINRQSVDGTLIEFRKANSPVGSIGSYSGSYLTTGTKAAGLAFIDVTTDQYVRPHNTTTNAISDGIVDLGSMTGRFKDLYLSGGVYLGGTTSANYLDDYERGDWIPEFDFAATSPTAGATTGSGRYVKVGNTVTVWGTVSNFNVTGGSGNCIIRGLPFASRADAALGRYIGSIRTNSATFTGYLVVHVLDGATTVQIDEIISGATSDILTPSEFSHGVSDVNFTVTYEAP